MAKKKPAKKPEPVDPAAEEIAELSIDVFEDRTFSITCCVCGDEADTEGGDEEEFCRSLHRKGWRYLTSEKYQMQGAMCPECVKTPDEKRGD